MTTLEQRFQQQIENAVAELLSGMRAAAIAALERALAAPEVRTKPKEKAAARTRDSRVRRRTSSEIEALTDKLYQAIVAQPGETMKTLCRELGDKPAALQIAVARLRRVRRIRTAGERTLTRYFPMA
jgi:hypothetical protein